ncbi:MAG: HI0074 family nucleotidyltransferase substrate-binding subunit [Reyranellaceae bacterium]
MADAPLILTPLKRALATLEEALAAPDSSFVRDSIVKRFEYTYELSWKMMQRYMKHREDDIPPTRRELFRDAARLELIDDPRVWFTFHENRNKTAHAYNEAAAREVIAMARLLAPAVAYLIAALERSNARSA